MKSRFNAIAIIIIILLPLSIMACRKQVSRDNAAIIKIAYESLDENNRRGLTNWENAEVEKYISKEDHTVLNLRTNTLVNIKNINTFRVNFRAENDGLRGPLTVYIKQNSNEVLGVDLEA